MSPPRDTEALTPAANPEGESQPHSHIPRKIRDDAIRVLHDNGYTVSGAEAYNLLRRWQRWRRDDVRDFIADEFLRFVRRGDLIQPRMKRTWRVGESGWRVRS
jgi:hypothetical protein